MRYKQLNLQERHYIELERKKGTFQKDIASALGRSCSTLCRELSRNTGQRGYRHIQANNKAFTRHKDKPKAIKLTNDIKTVISEYIEQDWSPEQVAGRLKKDDVISIHHETIYQYVLADKKAGGVLYTHLRHQNKTYRKRYGSAHTRHGITNRVDIDERPEAANKRERIGDWEGDTMIGKEHKGVLVTLDDRRSKLRLAAPLKSKHAKDVTATIIKLLEPIKDWVHTITFDNGKEFAFHKTIAKTLDCNAYFAKPYHSWERGQNENANGLLRQYFPKAMSLLEVTTKEVLKAVHRLNNRPKKCLGFKTPYEVFEENTGVHIKSIVEIALIT
ncbi:MAG: IS30 family transposase [Ghiorsea sp.]|nr:IS30 family transposase [Ghiorsea sp.]